MMRQRHQAYRAALWLACGLYLAACALPATKSWAIGSLASGAGSDHYVTNPGLACLAFGWLDVVVAVQSGWFDMLCWLGLADPLAFVRVELQFGMLAWLANPLAFVGAALLLARRPTGAAALGAASVVVGALYVIDPPDPVHPHLPQIGAWLWLGSLLAVTVAAVIRRGISQAQKHAEPPDGL